MANTIVSPNMNLPVPIVSQDPGPDYASNINACMSAIDSHDHTSGQGVPITPNGLNINADLLFGGNNATTLRSVRFQNQSSPLATSSTSDIRCVYSSGVDLYYNDGSGNQIQITQNGGIAGSPGSISNLTAPASAAYVSANSAFVWQSAANTAANLDARSIILRNSAANSKGYTINPPSAMGSDLSVTMPQIPGVTGFLTIDTGGGINVPIPFAAGITSANIAAGTITGSNIASQTITATNILNNTLSSTQIASKGILAASIADNTITGSQIANNVNLPGNATQSGSKNIVVQNASTANNLQVLRGAFNGSASILAGEGFTLSHTGTGVWAVTFSNTFNTTPVVVAVAQGASADTVCVVDSISSSGCTIRTKTVAGAATDASINFIAIG